MLPGLNLPASLLVLRPCFTAPGFAAFCGLASGLCGQVRRRTVVGMLLGGALQHIWPHDRAHYFFARARWELDQLGLAVTQLTVLLVVPPGADLEVAVDDSVFRRSGDKVHGAGWQHDGSSPSLSKLSYGNCFVTAGILVRLPLCSRAVCLPMLVRLHLPGKGNGPGKVEMAAALVSKLALSFPDRMKSRATVTIPAYGRQQVRHLAEVSCLWYGSWHTRAVRLILSRDEHTTTGYDLALVTTDPATSAGALVARYAARRAIEQAFADARNVLGAGEARNRVRCAVDTVPFALFVHTLVVLWYARYGHDPADAADRRAAQPWYRTKTEPAFEDMLIKLRRTMIAARFSAGRPARPTDDQIRAVLAAWNDAVA